MPIRAIVFDFDGLILDTEGPAFRAWQEVYTSHGVDLTLEAWQAYIGTDNAAFDPWDHLEDLVGEALDRRRIDLARRRRRDELMGTEELRPGIGPLIREAEDRGLALGVASSSPSDWVLPLLDELDLRSAFGAVLTADQVRRVKPAPELYLRTVEALSVAPVEAIALEDSPHGVAAAKAAGLHCVAVPNELTRHLDLSEADTVVHTLADVGLEALIGLVQDGQAGRTRHPD